MSPHWSNIFEGEKDLEASLNRLKHYSALSLGNIKKDLHIGGPFWRFRERAHCKRGQGAEACPELYIYDSFFIKWFTNQIWWASGRFKVHPKKIGFSRPFLEVKSDLDCKKVLTWTSGVTRPWSIGIVSLCLMLGSWDMFDFVEESHS